MPVDEIIYEPLLDSLEEENESPEKYEVYSFRLIEFPPFLG